MGQCTVLVDGFCSSRTTAIGDRLVNVLHPHTRPIKRGRHGIVAVAGSGNRTGESGTQRAVGRSGVDWEPAPGCFGARDVGTRRRWMSVLEEMLPIRVKVACVGFSCVVVMLWWGRRA